MVESSRLVFKLFCEKLKSLNFDFKIKISEYCLREIIYPLCNTLSILQTKINFTLFMHMPFPGICE